MAKSLLCDLDMQRFWPILNKLYYNKVVGFLRSSHIIIVRENYLEL